MFQLIFLSIILHFHAFGVTPSGSSPTETVAGESFQVKQVFKGSDIIWGLEFLDQEQVLFTEKTGQLLLLNLKTKEVKKIEGLPTVRVLGQGGLMDVKRHPNYPKEPWIYLTYAEPSGENEARTSLLRVQFEKQKVTKIQKLISTDSSSPLGQHFGSRIAFDDRGHLFFSVGDRGQREEAQKLSNHKGTILRLQVDGSIPNDNPFVAAANAKPEIWSYGHRNPQGIVYDKKTGRLWAIEHGPRGGDEINLIKKGLNYGWPVVSYGREYHIDKMVGEATEKEGMESPIHQYTPSIAPSSLMLYSGKVFSSWKNHFFAGALVLTHLNKIEINDPPSLKSEVRLLSSLKKRIRYVTESPIGEIYFTTDSGEIFRLDKVQK